MSSPTNPNPTRLFGAIVLAHLVWRIVCFSWGPLNLETWPGAAFEASAIAGNGLLVIWLVLGDGPLPKRLIWVGLAYLSLRLAMDLGVLLHAFRLRQQGMSLALELRVFRRVEDEVLACSFVLAIVFRLFSGWRVIRQVAADTSTARIQFRLIHLFLLTAIVSFLFAIAKSDWYQEFEGVDFVLFIYAVTIALAIFPALLILLPQPRWWTVLLMIVTWFALSPLIGGCFRLEVWFEMSWPTLRHLLTTILGPALVTSATALALRRAGYRLRPVTVPAKRSLPTFNPPA